MSSACHKCKFNGIGQILTAVVSDSAPSDLISARDMILGYVANECVECCRVSQDDIRIQHSPHNIAELQSAMNQDPSAAATKLPEEIEDSLREEMSTLFSLDPIQLLLVQHRVNGKSGSSFGGMLGGLAMRIGRYRGSSKAQASAMAHSVARKMPILSSMMIRSDGDD